MRRLITAILALAVGLVAAGPVAAGGQPDRSPVPAGAFVLPGGPDGYCAFDVLIEDVISRGTEAVFPPKRDGTMTIRYTGFHLVRATNLDTDASRTFVLNAMVTIWVYEDGRVGAKFGGPVLAYYSAAEADRSSLGAGIWYVRGTGGETYASDGTFLDAWAAGHKENLCETLAS